MALYNLLTCSGWEAKVGSYVGGSGCIKSRIGLVVLFFIIAVLRKWGGEEVGLDYNFLNTINIYLPAGIHNIVVYIYDSLGIYTSYETNTPVIVSTQPQVSTFNDIVCYTLDDNNELSNAVDSRDISTSLSVRSIPLVV